MTTIGTDIDRGTFALEQALAGAPFYERWRACDPGPSVSLVKRMSALPVFTKRDLRAHVPRGFIRHGHDAKAGFSSGEIEMESTSGTAEERVSVVWNQAWWDRSEQEAARLHPVLRREIASFLNASPSEIVFTRNSTEGINLVAGGLGLCPDDEVVLTALEHHSNYMPWRLRASPVPVGLAEDSLPLYDEVESVLSQRTRLLALAHVPNTTGVIAPVEEWAGVAHHRGLPLLIDASQSSSHLPLDVRALDCDFLVLSGHKLLGPSGIGVLYGKRERLEQLALYQAGGGMVRYCGEDHFDVMDVPQRFEAGTPNIEGAIGLAAAVAWLRRLGMDTVRAHSQSLGRRLVEGLRSIPGVHILADSASMDKRIGLATFTLDAPGFTQESLARLMCDRCQILVSGGYHCAHILHHRLGLGGTLRISTHVYNTNDEIDRALAALRELAG